MSQRLDLKSDLAAGLPYSLAHADALAAALAQLLARETPKKGLITDLDDTLWNGIVGEVGPQGVNWDLASHQQIHGLYQKLLASFSEEGVLVAIASKNDPRVVEEALDREDMILKRRHVFPSEVHWKAKSGSVERILRTWNVGADSVVFVDDSPMELAEVAAAHPGIECILFPKKSAAKSIVCCAGSGIYSASPDWRRKTHTVWKASVKPWLSASKAAETHRNPSSNTLGRALISTSARRTTPGFWSLSIRRISSI